MQYQQADISKYLAQPSPIEAEVVRLLTGKTQTVIFDIGACEGEDSIRYGRLFPGGRVFTFEPLPGNQEIIRANFATYEARNATLYPLALSDKAGEAVFHVSGGRPPVLGEGENWNYGNKSSSLLAPAAAEEVHDWLTFNEKVMVTTQTLDNFCKEQGVTAIDFIHMDVQGAESLVLNGAKEMLPSILAIWLEVANKEMYQGQKLRTDIEAFMRENGFILAFEEGHWGGIEGDQFYVNSRDPRAHSYLQYRKQRERLERICSLPERIGRRLSMMLRSALGGK